MRYQAEKQWTEESRGVFVRDSWRIHLERLEDVNPSMWWVLSHTDEGDSGDEAWPTLEEAQFIADCTDRGFIPMRMSLGQAGAYDLSSLYVTPRLDEHDIQREEE